MKFLPAILATLALHVPQAHAADMEAHKQLYRTLQEVGIEVVLNDKRYCQDENHDGSYFPFMRTLSICQDDAHHSLNGRMVPWSENDLDTLRHEAQHVVQDCNEGVLGDGELGPMFTPEKLLEMMKASRISREHYQALWHSYSNQPIEHRLLEMEAYMVASDVPADYIARKLVEFCE